MPPFFTIITATFNAASTLPRLLDSLAGQTCRDFEFILQDGASSDATLSRAESYRNRLPVLSVASEPDAGIYDAWNKALPRVSGRWVLFLGADDALADVDVLAKARQVLERVDSSVLYAVGGVTLFTGWGEYYGEFPVEVENAVKRLRRDMIFCHTGVFHNSKVFQDNSFSNDYYALGDYEFFCRTLRRDDQVIALNHTVTRMALGGVSSRLCSQPRIFRASARVALKHYGALSAHHLKVGCIAAVIAPLCRLLGPDRAARLVDATRIWRGKRPRWHQPARKPGSAATPLRQPLAAGQVAVVVLNHGRNDDTAACLAALERLVSPPRQIIVVDNFSALNVPQHLLLQWNNIVAAACGAECDMPRLLDPGAERAHDTGLPRRVILPLSENQGYAAGNNAGIRLALEEKNCAAVWVLNNDTEPEPGALDALCARLNQAPYTDMAGSTLVYAHDEDRVQCAGGASLSGLSGLTRFLCEGARRTGLANVDAAAVEASLDYITGASLLLRRDVFEIAGFLPEEYFLYYEDAAYGLSCRAKGLRLAWAPDSIVVHREGGSTGARGARNGAPPERPAWVDYLCLRNRIYLMRRFHPKTLPLALLGCLGVVWNRLRRGRADRIPLIWRATRDGLLGRMGKPADMPPQSKPHEHSQP